MIACCTASLKDAPNSNAEIDAEVAELNWLSRQVDLRRHKVLVRRNQSAPVARLPVETLVTIFGLSLEPNRTDIIVLLREKRRSFHPYARISHICHVWRQIALGASRLWTEPLFSRARITEIMTARAKDFPLTIKCDLSYTSALGALKPVLKDRPLRIVSLVGIPRRLKEAYRSIAADLRHLECLELKAEFPKEREDLESNNDENEDDDDDDDALERALNSSTAEPCDLGSIGRRKFKAPQLTKISLDTVLLSKRCGLFENVTDLYFGLHWGEGNAIWMAEEVLTLISNIPNLEILTLEWSQEGGDIDSWSIDHAFSLPKLRRLDLRVPPSSRRVLLRNLKSQALESLLMRWDVELLADHSSMIEMYSSLQRAVAPFGPPSTLHLRAVDDIEFIITQEIRWDRDLATGTTTLKVQGNQVFAFVPPHGEAYLKTQPFFCHFTSLHYSSSAGFTKTTPSDMISFFTWQTFITKLSFTGCKAGRLLIEALMSSDNDDHERPSHLPLLAKIQIKHGLYVQESTDSRSESILQGTIERYLQLRASQGLRTLDVLEVENSLLPAGSWSNRTTLQPYVREFKIMRRTGR
jgi:hypothetical protein